MNGEKNTTMKQSHSARLAQPQPSQRPKRRNSSKTHFRLCFSPASFFSFSLPLSSRLITDDPLSVLCRDLGREVDESDAPDFERAAGRDSRYQPPAYVSATSWCSTAPPPVLSSLGASIQPTTHRSSSTSAVGERIDVCESDMCEDCTGIRYCAYDHSDSKYLGRGR